MSKKSTGEQKIREIRKTQKNGTVYVYSRKYHYDPEKKNTVCDGDTLLYKIVDGVRMDTRHRQKNVHKDSQEDDASGDVYAVRKRTGSAEILDFIGRKSGIDQALYEIADIGTAQKILSIARYFVSTNGHTLPGITEWQYTHQLPYEDGLTEDVYGELFRSVGQDFGLVQNYFRSRIAWCGKDLLIAFDSTTESTYSDRQDNARYGFNKANDGLKTIKYLVLYSIQDSQPVAYAREPGNLPDVTSVANAIRQMKVLGARAAEVVTDNGYYSEENMAEFLHEKIAFITLVKTGLKWVRNEIDAHYTEFGRPSTYCSDDQVVSGITVRARKRFRYTCRRSDRRTGVVKGEPVAFEKTVYLHIYRDESKALGVSREFRKEIASLMEQINNGLDTEILSGAGQKKVAACLVIHKKRGGGVVAELNDEGIEEYCKYDGFMALVSSREKDAGECLRKYRLREHIEDSMEIKKDRCDGSKPRSWHDGTYNGKLFAQFVAMGYYDFLYGELRRIRQEVDTALLTPGAIDSQELPVWRSLKTWLHKMSLERILAWFDVYETCNVTSKFAHKIWTTENTKRDRLFLKLLGIVEG